MGLNYKDIAGNEGAKKALVLAAAGRHNVLITGPAAVRNALGEAIGSILPPLGAEQVAETARLYEQAGEPAPAGNSAPVRVVQPYVSLSGMIGGGRPMRPGEANLAHNGALVLSDLQDFSSAATSALAAVSEQGESRLIRIDGTYHFPADALLVATAAPCPCGGYGAGGCTCSPGLVGRYREHLGGRLMGQFEIGCDVKAGDLADVLAGDGVTSRDVRDQVMAAREFRAWREEHGIGCAGSVREAIDKLSDDALEAMFGHSARLNLCANQVACAASVARTAADVAGREEIGDDDVLAALAYRVGLNDRSADLPREFREQAWSEERVEGHAADLQPEHAVRGDTAR